jgi:hypothetical protein
MSLSTAIVVIVLADLALIAVLAYVMSRAGLLTPHVPATHLAASPAPSAPTAAPRPTRRTSAPRSSAVPARA